MPADLNNFYQDIRCLPNPEIAQHIVMEALFSALHKALVGMGAQQIGVSFPEYADTPPNLGGCMRLHGTQEALQALAGAQWLGVVRDYTASADILPVPKACQHRLVKRVQAKSSPARLRRRAMRRHGLDKQAAQHTIPDTAAERLRLPFVMISSASTGQKRFPLFISHEPVQEQPKAGMFSTYGLSLGGTVPWF
ncbi:type I-F CRISPR-associated endoribonuclease Cas6/Csy4 [Acetobacter cibinongensis]|uniref:CRISPR-associated protein Csy4 n=1 Tax=Acetobacter cibinongensis TaxID=146475 RepID=A0A0D6N2G6_9PROT|nr:type I-F CRISPR-associated endoribonuclease Cas6/Csy4 [Acetobacter cibinongensis]GAN60207.1 CRISPR-associated protein Csy4 [Acetobacter cibinongensis]GBQ18079.1 Csy4 family CRISPR-associated protein [Acetobacter cibinongensis NRIC 0482]GEL58297.1 type I-F CRISPR-associated endoribonuclease Cas6/Csy4 [Acetobacter cibinongensis]